MRRAAWVLSLALGLVAAGACSESGSTLTGTGGSGGTTGSAGATDSGGSGGGDTFACGTSARCQTNLEYCFFEEWNGATKVDYQCRPLPTGCNACACARADAATASMMCTTPSSLICIGSTSDAQTSATVNLWCMIP